MPIIHSLERDSNYAFYAITGFEAYLPEPVRCVNSFLKLNAPTLNPKNKLP